MPYQNPYLPQGYQPYATAPASFPYGANQYQQQPVHGFVYVTGMDGARAYQMPPNSEMPLFDSTDDGVMYIKTTDAAGFPTITVADCKKREQNSEPFEQHDYVTRDELDSTYRDLSNSIEQLKGAVYAAVPKTSEQPGEQGAADKGNDGRRSKRGGAAASQN